MLEVRMKDDKATIITDIKDGNDSRGLPSQGPIP